LLTDPRQDERRKRLYPHLSTQSRPCSRSARTVRVSIIRGAARKLAGTAKGAEFAR